MPDWKKVLRGLLDQPEPGLRNFNSYDELENWFELHDELRMPYPNLCDDYSEEAWRLAEADGFYLSQCLVSEGKAYQTVIFSDPLDENQPDKSVFHIANAARVMDSEEYYYVDLNWGKLIKLCNFYKGGKY